MDNDLFEENFEEKKINQPEILPKEKPIYLQLALPVSILVASLLISGTLWYTRGGSAVIGDKTKTGQTDQTAQFNITSADHILGDKNAKLTVVEFADFRCPFCERFYADSEQQIIRDFVNTGKARLIFKNYAFLGQSSIWASEAAECAGEQNKYWEMYNWLFSNQAPESDTAYYSKANLIKYAGKVGLNTAQFTTCINNDKYAQKVSDDLAQGKALGISGTPTILLVGKDNKFDLGYIKTQLGQGGFSVTLPNGNVFIVGAQPYATFKAAIDAALK